jgi:hypothetical protein
VLMVTTRAEKQIENVVDLSAVCLLLINFDNQLFQSCVLFIFLLYCNRFKNVYIITWKRGHCAGSTCSGINK